MYMSLPRLSMYRLCSCVNKYSWDTARDTNHSSFIFQCSSSGKGVRIVSVGSTPATKSFNVVFVSLVDRYNLDEFIRPL